LGGGTVKIIVDWRTGGGRVKIVADWRTGGGRVKIVADWRTGGKKIKNWMHACLFGVCFEYASSLSLRDVDRSFSDLFVSTCMLC
jgi:hypothetical protein